MNTFDSRYMILKEQKLKEILEKNNKSSQRTQCNKKNSTSVVKQIQKVWNRRINEKTNKKNYDST